MLAGAVQATSSAGECVTVQVQLRGGGIRTLEVDAVVRCIGPAVEDSDLASPLLRVMVERETASRDEAGLGIRVDAEGRVLDSRGIASETLSALGALRRAEAWESTAVPEIARDAVALAARIRGLLFGAEGAAPRVQNVGLAGGSLASGSSASKNERGTY